MYKDYYSTKFGALLGLISNRNYSTPIAYKIFYFFYYFITVLTILETLYDKHYVVLSILAAVIFIVNGRKYEDKEILITEYLPIPFRERVREIYLTTYMFLVPAVIIDFVFQYFYRGYSSTIEYVYALITVIIISNLAIIQMVLTKRSFLNFVIMDGIIYALGTKSISLVLNGSQLKVYDSTKFSIIPIIGIIILAIVFKYLSEIFLVETRRGYEVKNFYRYVFAGVITALILIHLFQTIKDSREGYKKGFEEAYNSNVIVQIKSSDLIE